MEPVQLVRIGKCILNVNQVVSANWTDEDRAEVCLTSGQTITFENREAEIVWEFLFRLSVKP